MRTCLCKHAASRRPRLNGGCREAAISHAAHMPDAALPFAGRACLAAAAPVPAIPCLSALQVFDAHMREPNQISSKPRLDVKADQQALLKVGTWGLLLVQ